MLVSRLTTVAERIVLLSSLAFTSAVSLLLLFSWGSAVTSVVGMLAVIAALPASVAVSRSLVRVAVTAAAAAAASFLGGIRRSISATLFVGNDSVRNDSA